MDFPNLPVFPASPTKAPLTPHGFKDATTDGEKIADWWDKHPDALVAVPTGKPSGLLVIDIDPEAIDWCRQQDWGGTRVHRTRRGYHLLFQMPEVAIGCSSAGFPKGVDVRADGGYIIWWPAHGNASEGDAIQPAPEWLLKLLRPPRKTVSAKKAARPRLTPDFSAEFDGIGAFSCWQ